MRVSSTTPASKRGSEREVTFTLREATFVALARTTIPLSVLPLGWRGKDVPALCPDRITVMPLPCFTYGYACAGAAAGGERSYLSEGGAMKEMTSGTESWSDPIKGLCESESSVGNTLGARVGRANVDSD